MRSVYLAGAAVLLCAFALGAATLISVWSLAVPEAVAVDIAHQAYGADFDVYIALHDSWHAGRRVMPEQDLSCAP